MGGKKSKSTKKFERNHLKDAIDRRKDFAKVKQRHQVKAKKQQRAAKKAGQRGDRGEEDGDSESSSNEGMNDDKYFQEAVTVPGEVRSKKESKASGKRKRDAEIEEQNSRTIDNTSDVDDAESGNIEDASEDELDMAALAEKDPEFHKFLKDNDPELLDFNEDDDLEGLSVNEDEEAENADKPKKRRKVEEDPAAETDVTMKMVQKWKTTMAEQHSIRALREVVLAFRAAAHMNDGEDKDYKYSIPSSDVYHQVLVTALQEAPKVLSHHLPIKETANGKVKVSTDSASFRRLSPLIKTFTASLNHLLSVLSDSSTLRLTLQSFEPLLPYLLQFRKVLKQITKSVASIWSDNSSNEATRITAFLVLRRLLTIGDAGIKESVLKATYEGLIKGSRNTTPHTIAGINLMKNSAAELWGIDQKVAYTTGFTFIRQAAIHLRTNVTKPSKDSYKTIYNWQFVHSLDFWSRVLSMHCSTLAEAQNGSESQLRPLIYPVVQITLGVMRMIPTSTYFPLRFQLMRAILRISQSTGTYVPLSAALLEVLQSSEMKKPAKPATLKSLDFEVNIRAPTTYLKTRVYQDGTGEQVVELFSEFFALWCKNIAYPELQLPVTVMLKRWLKAASKQSGLTGNKNAKVNQSLLLLVQKSEANARWIEERRNKISFTPRDRAAVETFLKDVSWEETPLGAFVVGQRKLREERAKTVAGRNEEEKQRRKRAQEEGSDEEMADIQTI